MIFKHTFPVGALQCNCTVLGDPDSGEAIVIDPGGDVPEILNVLLGNSLRAVAIVHTHAHIDHIGGTAELAQQTGAKTWLHADDYMLHQNLEMQAQLLGMPKAPETQPIDAALCDNGVITFGDHELGVLHTPGHSPGSVCFSLSASDLCFSGDTLFCGSIGRTDLWGGDFAILETSIRDRLYTMNGATQVVTGHGPETSIDRERRTNPFVQGRK